MERQGGNRAADFQPGDRDVAHPMENAEPGYAEDPAGTEAELESQEEDKEGSTVDAEEDQATPVAGSQEEEPEDAEGFSDA